VFSLDMLRRDEKQRLAAVDTGVPATAYRAVIIQEPDPFGDQSLTVYAQDPATLGHDQYLLTNPAGLRELSEALTASASTHQLDTDIRASFSAEKSFGPTNPGNSAWINDPGVIGALYGDPNTLINATGHPFMDRSLRRALCGSVCVGAFERTMPAGQSGADSGPSIGRFQVMAPHSEPAARTATSQKITGKLAAFSIVRRSGLITPTWHSQGRRRTPIQSKA
jgi:hypothetical protein